MSIWIIFGGLVLTIISIIYLVRNHFKYAFYPLVAYAGLCSTLIMLAAHGIKI